MSGDRHSLFLELTDGTAKRAVEPELGAVEGSEGEFVDEGVMVCADDLRSLRAALNGWTRLASVASDERIQP